MDLAESGTPSPRGNKYKFYPSNTNASEKKCSRSAHRILFILLILLTIAAAVFLSLFLVYFFKYEDKKKLDVDTTVNGVQTAAMVAKKMDASVDPCEDFAEFACGKFIRTAKFGEGETGTNSFSVLRDRNVEILKSIVLEEPQPDDPPYLTNMRNLYHSCMDEAKIEAGGLQSVLNSSYAQEWPTLIDPTRQGDATFDLNKALVRYMKKSVAPFFSFAVTTDEKYPTRHVLAVSDPSQKLNRELFLRPRNDLVLQGYETYVRDFAIALGAEPAVAARDATAFVDLEIQIANITTPPEEQRDSFKLYNPTTLGALRTSYPFLEMASGIRAGFSVADMTLPDDLKVNVIFPSYFEKLQAIIGGADKRALMNLFGFKYAFARLENLTKRLRHLGLEWDKVRLGQTEESPRWKTCLNIAADAFSLGVAKEFTTRTFSEDSKKYINVMVDHLKEAFRNILHEATWMSNQTKGEAYRKLHLMNSKIGYPDVGYDVEHFTKKYENLTMTTDNFYRNKRTLFWVKQIQDYQKLFEPVDRNKWDGAPFEVNAFFQPWTNEIVFPAGILQSPFFSDIFPDAINYGAIGTVIGHEITHGFDDQGKQYDGTGTLRNWLQPEDEVKFKAKTKCLVDQYNNFRDESVGLKVNGINTQGENVADNGGLKESYRAYKRLVQEKGEAPRLPGLGLTNDQLFFLSFAQSFCDKATKESSIFLLTEDVHAPGRFRILGSLQNNPEFAKVYNCPLGCPMNPETKCSVW